MTGPLVHCLMGGRQNGRASLRHRGPCPRTVRDPRPGWSGHVHAACTAAATPEKPGPGILPGPVSVLENDAQKVMLQLSM